MPKTAFILSSGRTGTKFLAEFFSANYPGVLALHEPPPSYHLRMLANAYLSGSAPRWLMIAALRASRASVMRRRAGRTYVESNPFLFGFADVLGEVFATPFIFHIVRDPREFVRSAINHGSASGRKWLTSSLIPFWFPDVRRLLHTREKLSPVGIFAGQWRLVNEFLSKRGPSLPGYHCLKFEEVFDAQNSGLRRMCELLELPYPGDGARLSGSEKVNVGKLDLIGRWPTWTSDQCRELSRGGGALMRDYGYGGEPEWERIVSG